MTQRVPVLRLMLLGLALVGCPTSTPDAPRTSLDANGASRSPDGTGYCCPRGTPSCDCTPLGGYSADGVCPSFGVCDARPSEFVLQTDEHGCEYYTVGLGSCLSRPDGG